MSTVRVLLLATCVGLLPAPQAQASELVKLARMIVTGKRVPTVSEAAKPAPRPADAAPAAPLVEARQPAFEPAHEPQEPALPTRHEVAPRSERVGALSPRGAA